MFCSKEYFLVICIFTLTLTTLIVHYGGFINQSKLEVSETEINNSKDDTLENTDRETGIENSQVENTSVSVTPTTTTTELPPPLSPSGTDEGKENDKDKSKDMVKVNEDLKPTTTPSSKRPSLLQYLLDEYKTYNGNEEKQLEVLIKLEDLSERYENAVNLFTKTDALDTVFLPALNSTSIDIRGATCSLFAVAGHNNPIVQSISVKRGVLIHMIKLMKFVPRVRPNALHAITSLLRNYPDAQKKFILDEGVTEIMKIGYLAETRRRILTFLTDLINERSLCRKAAKESPIQPIKPTWDESIVTDSANDPCDKDNLLIRSLEMNEWWKLLDYSIRYLGDHDVSGEIIVIDAIHASLDFCTLKLRHMLPELQNLGKHLENDPDFKETKKKLDEILIMFSSPIVEVLPIGIPSSSRETMSSNYLSILTYTIVGRVIISCTIS